MRRTWAAAVLAAGVLAAAAACSDGGGDGGEQSTAEICDDLNTTLDPLDAELSTAMSEAGLAAGQGDQAALAEAAVELNRVVDEVTGAVRQAAADTSDDEFRSTLETFADELDGLAAEIESGNVPDTQAFESASDGVSQYCD